MADEEELDNAGDEAAENISEDVEGLDGDDGDEDSNQIVMIAGAAVLLLIAVVVGLYFTGMLDGLIGKKDACVEVLDDHGDVVEGCEEHVEGAEGEHAGKTEGEGNVFFEIPPMIVNLNSQDGTPRYLRLSVQLEMYNEKDKVQIETVMPRVIDQFQTYLRELRVKDLRGSSGIYRLQTELLWRVNQAADPLEIKDVLFQEILIQ